MSVWLIACVCEHGKPACAGLCACGMLWVKLNAVSMKYVLLLNKIHGGLDHDHKTLMKGKAHQIPQRINHLVLHVAVTPVHV